MHEAPEVPPPNMSSREVLRVLAVGGPEGYKEALVAADTHRSALVGPLLAALGEGVADPFGPAQDDATFPYALYLLAKWREPGAYAPVVGWLSLPEEGPFEIGGDVVTQDGGRILASVFDGNLEPIKTLILNRDADEFGRSAGITALMLLAVWGEIPRAVVIDHFSWLASEGLERVPSAVWNGLASDCVDLEAVEILAELRRAYDDGLIDPQFMTRSEIEDMASTPAGQTIRRTAARYPRIDDVAAATAWWDRTKRDADEEDDLGLFEDEVFDDDVEPVEEVPQPYRAPPKIGRNEPCPCGSGKKYKKCHGG